MNRRFTSESADTLGMAVSGACMVHCFLTPILLALAPGLAHYLPGDETTHRVLAVLVFSFGAFALVRGYRLHRKRSVIVGLVAGVSLVMTGAIAGQMLASHVIEISITLAGSAAMVFSHWKNRAFCYACTSCDHDSGGDI
jgi:hypothetical protein